MIPVSARILMLGCGALLAAGHAQTFRLIYNFPATQNGEFPNAVLLHGPLLYGTTQRGGASGFGTIYQIRIAGGSQTVLHNFAGGAGDGAYPMAGVIRDSAGNLYGTTQKGGAHDDGTVFKLGPGGAISLLYSFSGPDGKHPYGSLILDGSGNLYGTASEGGTYGRGTVFSLSRTGHLTTLHSFDISGGESPQSGLVLKNGNLYGTTPFGGASGFGTVFRVNHLNGRTVILHQFSGGADGMQPSASLVVDNVGNLYGTTAFGGNAAGSSGDGVVFKVNPSSLTVLYTFQNQTDGSHPSANLLRDAAGNLYGTAQFGGASGKGTVFELDGAGTLTTLHSFVDGTDGGYPGTGLVRDAKGNLYGSATDGASGLGTVYEIKMTASRATAPARD